MTTITATPNASTGAVDLLISQTSVVTQVLRSNSYGVQQLRSQTGQFPTAASGTTVVSDYECSAGTNTYTASCTDTTVRTNIVTNPSPGTGTGWGTNFGYGTGTTTFGAVSGFPSANASISSWSTAATSAWNVQCGGTNGGSTFPIPGGAVVTGSLTGEHSWAGGMARITFEFFDSTGAHITYDADPTFSTIAANTPQRLSYSTTAPSNAASVQFFWDGGSQTGTVFPPAGATATVGAALIEKSSTLGTYFDGSTSGDSDNVYAWTGAVNGSTSTYTHYTRSVSATTTVEIDSPWLLCPIAPEYSEQATSVTAFSSSRSTNSTVHQIIGRADPIVVMGKLGTRSGKLEVFASSISDAERLSNVFSRGETVLLKQGVSALDFYFIPGTVSVDPYAVDSPDTTMFKMTLDFTEVARPYGDLAGALGWNYDALGTAYASYDAVTAAFATFDDLTLDSVVS